MQLFEAIKKNVSLSRKVLSIDNHIFKLYYRLTFWFLLGCTATVCYREYVKEHIACTGMHDKDLAKPINTFCFIMTTFTVPRLHNESVGSGVVAAPGVGPVTMKDDVKYHSYYQWVPYVLFFQALGFYLPHLIWKTLEGKRIKGFVEAITRLNADDIELSIKEGKTKPVRTIIQSLLIFRVNRDWAVKLVICELMNFAMLITQIYLVNRFLTGQFLSLGSAMMHKDSDQLLESIFPKVTKCTFYKYGAGGSMQWHDYICVLPINLINVWVYCIQWYWFAFLLCASIIGLLWRICSFFLHNKYWFSRLAWGEVNPGRLLKIQDVEIVSRYLTFSEWLFLYYIAKNLGPMKFRQFFKVISEDIQRRNSSKLEETTLNLKLESKEPSESSC